MKQQSRTAYEAILAAIDGVVAGYEAAVIQARQQPGEAGEPYPVLLARLEAARACRFAATKAFPGG